MKDEKIKIELGPVQKTLFVPLLSRAKELEKEYPLIIDSFAKEIVAKIDYDFSMIESEMEKNHQIVWIIRSFNFDNCVKDFLLSNTNALIVNIGAGLDTTFHRVDNGNIYWINLDLPDVINLRQRLIPDSEREISIAKSILDFTWINSLNKFAKDRPVLFLSAGVFCYFTENEIKTIFKEISNAYPLCHLIFDAMSWLTVWGANRSIMKKSGIDSSSMLKWYLRKTSILKKWVDTIEIVDNYSMFSKLPKEIGLDKKVLRGMKIADFFGMYKMIHCKL
jgi:O-methyltransferase involved in polyketide biosynthesis